MPPNQATLGYVKSSQSTLGKFFGGPNGSKATPQQSKLAFASKSKPEVKSEEASSQEQINGQTKVKGENGVTAGMTESCDVAMTDIKDEEAQAEEADAAVKSEPSSTMTNGHAKQEDTEAATTPSSSRKRQSPGSEEMSDGDDEPPVKKQRRKSAIKSKKLEDLSVEDEPKMEKSSRKSVKFEDDDDAEAGNDKAGKPKKAMRKPTPKKAKANTKVKVTQEDPEEECDIAKEDEDEDDVSPIENSIESPARSEEVTAGHEDVESEDDKPEVSARTHAEIQSTFKAKSKDPYPDWKAGDPVPYAALCTTFSKIEMTTKRLEISAHCSLFLRQVLRLTPKDVLPTVLLMINKLAADYAGIELGIGESLIMKAIGESTGRNLSIIKTDQNEIGDLGLVAAKSRSNQPTMFKPKPLTVRGVHEGMMGIATTEGQGAQGRKVGAIKKLLSAADAEHAGKGSKSIDITKDKGGPSEAKYIIRMLEGKMRLGLAEKTVLVALASAMVTHEISQKGEAVPSTDQLAKGETILKSVYSELPSYEVIIPAMLEHGIFKLKDSCKLQPGVPLKPMLAKPTKSITEVLDRFEGHDFSCEYKYDGERAQIHFVAHDSDQQYASTTVPTQGKSERGISNIFSRNSEDLSKKYPDILAKLPTWVKEGTKSFVLDCETVAWDMVEKKVLPFQQLMTRKRKDVKVEDVKVKVCVFAFDILFLNGEPTVNKPFRERREALHDAFNEVEGEFAFATYGNTSEIDTIQTLLEDSVKASCEGLMVKMLDGTSSFYEPSRRSQNWLKVKKDYLAGAGDSLDLVVLGAYFGKGKRTSVYGAFLLAAYDATNQTFASVCNIGTGFSEQVLEDLHNQLSPLVIEKPKPFYAHSTGNKDQPDVWFEPRYVWEVKSADLTLSPRYVAAADAMGGKGISLRFPRFLRVRDDKKPEDATSTRQVAELYHAQEGVSKTKAGPSVDDEFEY